MRSRLVALFLLHPFGGAFFIVSPSRPDIRYTLVRNLNLWTSKVIEGGKPEDNGSYSYRAHARFN